MNMIGWLAGGGSAPLVVGMFFFVNRDVARMQEAL
jgi:hypothetical protein